MKKILQDTEQSQRAATSAVARDDLLAKIFELDTYEPDEFGFASSIMAKTRGGDYVRLKDVVNLVHSFNG